MRWQLVNGMGFKVDFTLSGPKQTTNGMQRGGFTRAIGAKNGDNLALPDMQVNSMQRRDVAVANMQIFYFKQHGGGIPGKCNSAQTGLHQ